MTRVLSCARFLGLVVGAGLIAACQTGSASSVIASSAYEGLPHAAAIDIANDLVVNLTMHVDRSAGTIQLNGDGTTFAEALGSSLIGLGYAVATDQEMEGSDVLPLAYIVDRFETGIMARLSTGQVELTRIYSVTNAGAAPSAPLSVMTRREAGG